MVNIRSSEENVVPVIKNYIGIGNFKVVGINSNLAELEQLGYSYKQEPQYKVELGGEMLSKLAFYVVNEALNIRTKLEFLISSKEVIYSQSGKRQFINNLAKSSIGNTLEECLGRTNSDGVAFFKNINARPAKVGEVAVMEFLISWFNIKNFVSQKEAKEGILPDEIVIDFDALVKGNVSELRGLLDRAKNNEVKLMLTVNNGYTTVYNKYFDRATANLNNFRKHVADQEKQGYPPKGDYIVADLMEFTGSTIKPDSDIPNTGIAGVPAF